MSNDADVSRERETRFEKLSNAMKSSIKIEMHEKVPS